MYKYEVEDELKNLNIKHIYDFRKFINKQTKNTNAIIMDKKEKKYFCTYCQRWHYMSNDEYKALKKIKRKEKMRCVFCNNTFEVIYKRNVIKKYIDYITVIETNKRNEIIIRVFWYQRTYNNEKMNFDEEFLEVERINYDRGIYMKNNSYKGIYGYDIYHRDLKTDWKRDRSGFYRCYYYDNCASNIRSIRSIIKRHEKYKYSVLDLAAKNNIDILAYLEAYPYEPKLELMLKMGCTNIVKDIIYKYNYGFSSWPKEKRLLNKDGINFIIKHNATLAELVMRRATGTDDIDMIRKMISIRWDPNESIIAPKKKTIDYIYKNQCSYRFYKDYINMCRYIGEKLDDKKILYPEDLKKEHDVVNERYKIVKSETIDKKIKDYAADLKDLIYQNSSLIVRPAQSQQELINESQKMNHCVKTYASDYGNRETAIFFIRRNEDKDEPYVTVELRDKKIEQCRTKNNGVPDDQVKRFVEKWATNKHLIVDY